MLEVAAEELEVAPEDLETDGVGNVRVMGAPQRSISVMDVALAAHFKQGRTISGRGIYLKPKSTPDPETGEMDPDSGHAHACTVAEVEVDTETGVVRVTRLVSSYEVGRAINPAMVQQQVFGGAFMGMAHALYETTAPYYPDPENAPKDWSEYILPGWGELVDMDSIILQRPLESGPCGAKGVGEMTANSPIAAIVNAVADAIGVRITSVPITLACGPEDAMLSPGWIPRKSSQWRGFFRFTTLTYPTLTYPDLPVWALENFRRPSLPEG